MNQTGVKSKGWIAGQFVGELLGEWLGVQANVGRVGIAMLLLVLASGK